MATTVDIIVKAKDSQLDRLQRKMERLGRVTKSADNAINALDRELSKLGTNAGMDAAIRDIDIYRGKLAQARLAARALGNEKTRPAAGGGAQGGDSTDNVGLTLLSAVQGKKLEESADKLKDGLRQSAEFSERIGRNTDELDVALGKVQDKNKKIADQQDRIEDASKSIRRVEGQRKALLTRIERGLIKQPEKIKEAKVQAAKLQVEANEYQREITSATRSITQHKSQLEGLEQEWRQARRAVDSYEADLDRVANNQAKRNKQKNQRAGNLQAAGVGLGFANIPGQDIFQAGAAGALITKTLKGGLIAAAVAGVAKLTTGLIGLSKETAKAFSEISRFQLALSNVAGDRTPEALEAINRAVKDFNIPLVDATKNFTQLLAAADSAQFSLGETEQVFRALAAANKALGGDAEKLRGILLATTQVFSKGRVSAEELRGQIGERLAGAFADFATASGISTAELDKNLQRGEVTLQQFVQFASFLLRKYEEDAKVIASGPDEAGARLKASLDQLVVKVGPTLRNLGASFQDFATEAIRGVNDLIDRLGELGRRAEQSLGGADALKLLQNAEAWRDSIMDQLIDPQTSAKRVAELKEYLGIAEKTVKEAQARLDKLKLGPPVPGTNPGSDPIIDPKTYTTEQSNALRDALAASDRAVDLEASQAALRLEEKRTEAIKAGASERLKAIDAAEQRLPLAAAVQKSEERLKVLRAERATLTASELQSSTIDKQIAEEQNRLAIAMNEAKRGGLQITSEQLIEDRKVTEELREQARLLQEGIDSRRQSLEDQFLRATAKTPEEKQDVERQIQKRQLKLEFPEATDEQLAPLNQLIDKLTGLNKETDHFAQTMEDLANTVGPALKTALESALVETIAAAISGAEDLDDKLRSLAQSLLMTVGKAFVNAGISGLAGNDGTGFFSILNGSFGRANGGPVSPNMPYIVGEREPELFVPKSAGTIYNQDQMHAAMSTYSNHPDGRTDYGSMSINVETTSINGMEFVTPEQFRKGTEDAAMRGAKMGEQRAMNRLRQSRSTRNKIGI